jgi:hypothetical protein
MRAREAVRNSISGKERAQGKGNEFATIVTLHTFDKNAKLSENICVKALKSDSNIRFISQGKRPTIMGKII